MAIQRTHNEFLQECFLLAETSAKNGESRVGAIIVKDGKVIGRGTEQSRALKDVTRHAEVVAVLDAIQAFGTYACKGATLYSNVEPCILCSYVIRHHEIGRVVYVDSAGDLGGADSVFPLLTTREIRRWKNPPEVEKIGP